MRKLLGVFAAGMLALGATGAAQAEPLPFTGSLAVQIATLPPIAITGAGVADVDPGVSFSVPGGTFATTGIIVPVTDPAAFPILGVQVTAQNGAGNFNLAGPMPILGQAKVCLFSPCAAPPPANVSVPLSVVGAGGTTTVLALVNLTVVGAPWTTGTAAVGADTVMGNVAGGGPVPGGSVQLVTPIFISTNIGASAVLPAFGIMTLNFVPEPGTLVLLGSGIAGLVMFGRSRRA